MANLWQQSQEGAAKEMTRQHTDCFSLYGNTTKFIKSFFPYSCNKYTDTSHTGSYQHYEPVNRVPKIGWVSGILPAKLEGANSGSMGSPNRGWIPTRLELTTTPYQAHMFHQIRCSLESKTQITTKVLELLAKGQFQRHNLHSKTSCLRSSW